jgi:hypothetical protein
LSRVERLIHQVVKAGSGDGAVRWLTETHLEQRA